MIHCGAAGTKDGPVRRPRGLLKRTINAQIQRSGCPQNLSLPAVPRIGAGRARVNPTYQKKELADQKVPASPPQFPAGSANSCGGNFLSGCAAPSSVPFLYGIHLRRGTEYSEKFADGTGRKSYAFALLPFIGVLLQKIGFHSEKTLWFLSLFLQKINPGNAFDFL